MKFRYNSKHIGLGYHTCRNCNRVFISGLKPSHEDNCQDEKEGWNVAVYNFGQSELKEVKEHGKSSNNPELNSSILESILQNSG